MRTAPGGVFVALGLQLLVRHMQAQRQLAGLPINADLSIAT